MINLSIHLTCKLSKNFLDIQICDGNTCFFAFKAKIALSATFVLLFH
jgi:hypothetical protein